MPVAIELLSMVDGWAVTLGDAGVPDEIVRLSNGQWAVWEQYEDRFLMDIDVVSHDEMWIAGFTSDQGLQGMLMHGKGGVFKDAPAPECQTLIGLQMIDSDEGWAVGQDDEFGTCIMHYEDGRWTREDSPGRGVLAALDLDQTGTGWAIGSEGLVLRRELGVWYEVPNPATERDDLLFLDLRRVGPDEAWAVGSNTAQSLHYIDGSWQLEDLGVPGTLTTLDVTPNGHVWAVGRKQAPNDTPIEQLEPLMLLREEGRWREVKLPSEPPAFGAIDMLDDQSGWALGFGAALRLGPPSAVPPGKSYLPLLHATR